MPHLREGGRYLVARFHASFGETFLRGQRLELVRIAVHHGDRHFYTEFHFRDLDSGRSRLWTVDGSHDEATGRDLFAALFTAEDAPVEPAAQPPASTTASDARAASDEDEAGGRAQRKT